MYGKDCKKEKSSCKNFLFPFQSFCEQVFRNKIKLSYWQLRCNGLVVSVK